MAPDRGIDTSEFSVTARDSLLELIDKIPGRKDVVFEKELVGPIELLVPFQKIKELGVDRVFFLENDNTDSTQRNIVFIARGEKPGPVLAIASQVKRIQQTSQIDHDFHIFWVPRRTLLSEKILEDAGVLGEVVISEFPMYFLQLEPDLISLELERAFGELYLDKDPSCILTSAKALLQIEKQHGLFPHITGKGNNAKKLCQLLKKLRIELSIDERSNSIPSTSNMISHSIDRLLIIDREVDFASPLLTQLTYEGLVDETFGITHSRADVDTSIIGAAPQQQQQQTSTSNPNKISTRSIKLDSSDVLYSTLRNAHFTTIGAQLNRTARRLRSDYDSRHAEMSVSEMRSFVSKLPSYQAESVSLKTHTSLLDEILKRTALPVFRTALEVQQNLVAGADPSALQDLVEDLIARNAPLPTVLRCLCIQSLVSGGLRAREFDNLRRLVVQAYGYKHLLTLDALEKMGLFTGRTGGVGPFNLPAPPTTLGGSSPAGAERTDYSACRRALRLIMDDVNEQEPTEAAYVHSGYAPLSVRLVQCVIQRPYISSLSRGAFAAAAGAAAGLAGAPQASSSQQNGTSDGGAAWRGLESLLNGSVRGATFDEAQSNTDKAARARETLAGRGDQPGGPLKTTLVFFLGGITFAEIAALRLLARQEEEAGRRRLVLATTAVISGDKMMQAAIARSQV